MVHSLGFGNLQDLPQKDTGLELMAQHSRAELLGTCPLKTALTNPRALSAGAQVPPQGKDGSGGIMPAMG